LVEKALLRWPEPEVLFSGTLYKVPEGQDKLAEVDLADALDAFVADKGGN
jgi:hypothetical protein